MTRVFLISKEEAFHICDKTQYCESTLWEKIKLNFRYSWCRTTRLYVNRNKKLTDLLEASRIECLEYSERKFLEDRLKERLKSQMEEQP